MNFNIITFGCKVNQYESNMMKEKMLSSSFCYTEDLEKASIIIINTCTVTNTADNKCLKTIRQIKNKYPKAILVVAGCSSQNKQELYKSLGIDILIGNKDKSLIASIIEKFLKTNEKYVKFYNDRNLEFEDMQIVDYNHVRAFIKIEDGCDNFCSYCIIPFVRGSVRCKDFNLVLEEAKSLAQNNHKEIVLTGIHTGRYFSNGRDLSDLIHELAKIEGIKRIRLSSIEVTELNDKFMEELKNNSKLCNHLHIPLQSGSEKILKKMNRKYAKGYFKEKIEHIRKIRPDISITTDIIVGHPFETDENFKECLDFVKNIKFAKIHVFPYSKREGTASAKMPNQVDEAIKKQRVHELIALSKKLEEEYLQRFKNQELDVLIETVKDGKSVGHTSNYLEVQINESLEVGKIYSRVI